MDELEKQRKRKALMDRVKALADLTIDPTPEELESLDEESRSMDMFRQRYKRRSLT